MENEHPEWDQLSPRERIALAKTLPDQKRRGKVPRLPSLPQGTWVWLVPLLVIVLTAYGSYENNLKVTAHVKQVAVELIKQGNYEKATMTLVSYIDNDAGAEVLYNFASAKKAEADGDMSMASYYLNESTKHAGLVSSYNGPLKETIQSYAKKIAAEDVEASRKQEQEQKRYEATRNQRGVHIGMTSDEVLQSSWGQPQHINRHRSAYGYSEQWVYRNYNYLYFEEDEWGLLVLTDIQN